MAETPTAAGADATRRCRVPRSGASRAQALAPRLTALVVTLTVLAFSAAPAPGAWAGSDPLRDMQYGLDRIEVEQAWERSRGRGVVIAILDTGVNLRHEDLRGQLVPGWDFVDGDADPMDENGHGTHVAGIAAAATGNGVGIAGVAPDAWIMPLRVLDASGRGTESDVADAIDFAVGRAADMDADLVINMSLTDLQHQPPAPAERIHDAVRRAWFDGAVIVAAAGNESLPFSDYPAAGPNVIAVGATDDNDSRAAFSNEQATVGAPGERIVSTYWDPRARADNAAYAYGTGTSMAAPFVSGVAALLLAAGFSNRETVRRIIETSVDLDGDGAYTFGMVNAARALGMSDDEISSGARPDRAAASRNAQFEEIDVAGPGTGGQAGGADGASKAVPGGAAVLLLALACAAAGVGRRQGGSGLPFAR